LEKDNIKTKNVLFLMFAFPDMSSSFNMYTALVEEFHKNGHQTFVVAPALEQKKTHIRKEKFIPVLRVRTMPLKNVSNYIKGLANLLLPYQYEAAINKFFPGKRFDLIISPTPPITLVDLAARIKRRHQAQFYLILRDIFPQNAVDLGFMKKGGIFYRYFRGKEKKLYKEADFIGCMSHGNVNYILKHNQFVADKKLHVLPNYQIKNEDYPFQNKEIKEKYGLKGKFVIVFGGNMGKPQQLENVLALAKVCEKYEDVVFLLLGAGLQKNKIQALIHKGKQRNIDLRDTIPKQDYQQLISACEIGLISLHQAFTIPNIPSKALDYFNLGIPVLASLDAATDFGKMLEEAQAGLWSYAGDIGAFFDNFEKLYHDPDLRIKMGVNGRGYFEKNLTPDLALSTILEQTQNEKNKNDNS
jgi:glycosyltransferase involved in cell wall biosynthesis